MRLRTLALAASLPFASLASTSAHAQASQGSQPSAADRAAVLAVIDGFTQGLRTKDTVMMAAHVDTLARMTLLRPAPGGGSRVMLLSAKEFMRLVSQPNQPALDEPIRNPVVHVDGDLASVWAEYQVRRDGAVSHCGFDAFHLARIGGTWRILNVSDTFRRTGCGEMWPK